MAPDMSRCVATTATPLGLSAVDLKAEAGNTLAAWVLVGPPRRAGRQVAEIMSEPDAGATQEDYWMVSRVAQ